MRIAAFVLFGLLYVVMIACPRIRVPAVWSVALVYLIGGILSPSDALSAIDWNVLLMMGGTMLLVQYFIGSKMPNRIADELLSRCRSVCMVTIAMSLFSGLISALIDNVATVLIVAPVGMAVCRRLKISPVFMVLSIAVSSNLQGAATLVGDATSIMLGSYAGMDFMSFFWMHGKPGIFFAVELGALATIPIMLFLFRKEKTKIEGGEKTVVTDYVPGAALVLMVTLLILSSFLPEKPAMMNGIICMTLAVIVMIYEFVHTRSRRQLRIVLYSLDYNTLVMLAGLFLVIEGVSEAGLIDMIAEGLSGIGHGNLFVLYSVIVWGSVLISAFVDNIPYVAAMLPVVARVAAGMGVEPYLLYFGLLCGATLGGNLTPVGASANITAAGILERSDFHVSFRDFAKIGIPFTLTAVSAGYVFLWIVWR